jgi:hypothetical protein
MLTRHSALALLAGLALTSVACSSTSASDAGESTAAATVAEDAASLITVSPNLPFEVKRIHAATGRILNARWGQHGGPVATLADDASSAPIVTRWWIPNSPNAPASQQPLQAVLPDNLPEEGSFFWNNDGFLDTAGGALMSWSGVEDHFTGQVVQYSKNYEQVVSKNWVNGYYAGANLGSRLVYSGLSGVTAAPAPAVNECGLWGADFGSGGLLTASAPSTRLIKWSGASGPVASDNNGNVFVAAFLDSGENTDAIYALSKTQSLAHEAQTQVTIAETKIGGTASLATASVPGSGKGWVFAKGWDTATAQSVFARQYSSTADAVTVNGDVLKDAIKPVLASSTVSMFGDPKGNLWITVTAEAGAWLIELEPKAP